MKNPRALNPKRFRHERVTSKRTLVRKGLTKYRTKTAGSHRVIIAFPKGRRRKGSGKVSSVLHPIVEKNPRYRVAGWTKILGTWYDYFMRSSWGKRYYSYDLENWKPTKSEAFSAAYPEIAKAYDASRKNPARKNPPRTLIYSRAIEILASKAGMKHQCDEACRRVNHVYRHRFSKMACIFGLPDGSVLIK